MLLRAARRNPARALTTGLPAAVLALTVLAAALRVWRLGYGYAHPVADYDGSVYLSSSLALIDGRLPYRDFVLVQPPGVTVLLAPIAWLAKGIGTAQAMGLARLLTVLAGTASVPLTAVVLRHRGTVPAVLGAAVVAVQSDAIASASVLLLEPWLVLACLGAVALAFTGDEPAGSRRELAAGLLLGFAVTLKIWALAPAAVMLLVLRRAGRGRRLLAGVALGAGVPLAPFVLADPGAFVHQVVLAQITRSAPHRTTAAFRLVHLLSSAPPNATEAGPWAPLVVVAVVVLAALTAAWVRRPPRTPLEWCALGCAAAVVAMLFVPDTFYWHYATFGVPFLVLAGALRLPATARGVRWRPVLSAVVAGTVVLGVVSVWRYTRPQHPYDNHRALQAAIPPGACVVSSTPGALIAADRLSLSPACPLLLDPFGIVLAETGGHSPTAAQVHRPQVVRTWLAAYERADFVYLQPRVTPQFPTDGPAQDYLDAHFVRLPLAGPGELYRRVG